MQRKNSLPPCFVIFHIFSSFSLIQASGRDRRASVVNNSPYWMQRNTGVTVEDYTKQNCFEELHINVIKPNLKIFKGLSKAPCKAVNWMNCIKSSRNLWLCLTWSFFFFYEVKHIRDSIYDGFLQFLLNLLIQLVESRIKWEVGFQCSIHMSVVLNLTNSS